MNYLIKVIAACLLTTLSITSYGQSLNAAINKETASGVKLLNLESKKYYVKDADYLEDEPMKFDLDNKEIIMKDINSDGIQDAITLLYYCEEKNCHATTKSVDLVVFKGLGKNQFTKLGSASLESNAKIKSVDKGVIKVISYSFGNTDPGCCPSKESLRSYKVKNGKLVKAN